MSRGTTRRVSLSVEAVSQNPWMGGDILVEQIAAPAVRYQRRLRTQLPERQWTKAKGLPSTVRSP